MAEIIPFDEIVAITGHRLYPDRSALISGLDDLHAREYIFGGARGVDSDALEYIGRTQPRSIRTVVVPNRLSDQPRLTQSITRRYATNVVELKNTGLNRYRLRNQYMVDRATHVRAFYDFRGRGGTFNTIQYAKSKGKNLTVWPMQNLNKDEILAMNETKFRGWMKNMRGWRIPLAAIKSIIQAYFQMRNLQIPPDIVIQLGQWKLNVWW